MKTVVEELSGLDTTIEEGGNNFSVGQRQLLCIARALLQSCKILLLDEVHKKQIINLQKLCLLRNKATASIDIETDNLIQRTIKESFAEHTMLTIAHRLHTIIECDRIMVMDKGRLVEYDSPHNLLNRQSLFLDLVNESDSADYLKSIAARSQKD